MLGEEGNGGGGAPRRPYPRSVSWTDRKLLARNRPRPSLPPLQPLSITRRSVEDWPSAGSDDLGVWPQQAQTPRGTSPASEPGRPGLEFEFQKDKLAFYDKECSRIAEHVYLGSDTVAKNHGLLRQNEITHVLNCVGFVCPEYFKSEFVYKTLWLHDSPSEDITSILYDVFDYFEDVREQKGRVLVHCCQGVSRSTSLVIAYLMWREGQSFEDAFHYVKNMRGVTNPNMGFACQLLQCQKRVHALPASPNSIVRMYRMAPHSSYDPLHLVPKSVTHPSAKALDSRGAYIVHVHVPSAIYVWIGKHCTSAMACNAKSAAVQVIRYERVTGSVHNIDEDEEPLEFWAALSNYQQFGDVKKDVERMEIDVEIDTGIRPRNVEEYDLDFEIFNKALAGGVVPPFSLSDVAGSETCLPAREVGWGRLRRKLASGIMKGLFNSPKCSDTTSSKDESGVKMDEENQHPVVDLDPLPPSSKNHVCDGSSEYCELVARVDSSLPPSDSFPSILRSSQKFSSKASTISPNSSECASSFTSSPSSQQPSLSESTEPFCFKDVAFSERPSSLHNSSSGAFLANKGSAPSIAERRGSKPPRMLLRSASESENARRIVRSQSFALPDMDGDLMKNVSCKKSDGEQKGN
ncbi:protein-tyrosine-phosphatase MKP1-like [Lotus japonicus]|uniref:protein-tyrosine-phosphatase MKP1-like n=1 Tax=Lotus japonicus TaxID=34305 RepID=UPI0025837A24|nr:protein-tyrosine-phosphatase MKP1-like [Lotus japonicus]